MGWCCVCAPKVINPLCRSIANISLSIFSSMLLSPFGSWALIYANTSAKGFCFIRSSSFSPNTRIRWNQNAPPSLIFLGETNIAAGICSRLRTGNTTSYTLRSPSSNVKKHIRLGVCLSPVRRAYSWSSVPNAKTRPISRSVCSNHTPSCTLWNVSTKFFIPLISSLSVSNTNHRSQTNTRTLAAPLYAALVIAVSTLRWWNTLISRYVSQEWHIPPCAPSGGVANSHTP